MTHDTCTGCLRSLPIEMFHRRTRGKYGRRRRCKDCYRSYQRDWKYGLPKGEYERLLEQQNHLCAICGKKEKVVDKYGNIRELVVDHNHETGKVRALLCNGCNTLLGFVAEDQSILIRAVDYLRRHGK